MAQTSSLDQTQTPVQIVFCCSANDANVRGLVAVCRPMSESTRTRLNAS